MGIRETLNKNPGLTTGATAGIIVLAIAFIIYQLSDSGYSDAPGEAFYTVDEGKTRFGASADKVAPFDHEGKPAYKMYVYKCGDGKEFISHLERYTPEGKKAMEAALKGGAPADSPLLQEDLQITGIEVKDVGTDPVKGWVKQSDPRAARIMELKCPDGNNTNITAVLP